MKLMYHLLALLAIAVVSQALEGPDARELVKRGDQRMRGQSSHTTQKMTLIRPDWSRELTMESWSLGRDRMLVLIREPARDQGTVFLKRDAEVWNWIPSVERVIKIPPSMMMQNWMGSDFTNDDLVKESSLVVDYTHELVGDSLIAERDCWQIRLTPKPDAAVVWGSIDLWITKELDLELLACYYDEDGELVNTLVLDQIREIGGRVLPTRLSMQPADKPEQRTIIETLEAEFNQPVTDDFFSERNMRRVR